MTVPQSVNANSNPLSEADIQAVRFEMNRMVETERFKNSRRFPLLLRYLVEETLEGRGEQLKERSIGVCVFGCPADYDTAENPIVRVTIAEVRKRIAQYYQEEGASARMRIELRPGHYQPRFFRTSEAEGGAAPSPAPENTQPQTAKDLPSSPSVRRWRSWILVSALLVLAVLLPLLGYNLWNWSHPSALSEFWNPLLADHRTVIFCLPLGNDNGEQTASTAGILIPDAATPAGQNLKQPLAPAPKPRLSSFQSYEILGEPLVFSDTVAVVRISNYLAAQHRDSTLRLAPATSLEDLRAGPVILIGAIDNPWTLHALASLPFRFAGTAEERYWIYDRSHPNSREWGVDIKQQVSEVKRDYAILARIYDESTGKVEIVVAGIGMSGTAVAAQFAVDPQQIELLRRRIGPAFRDHSFEVVLSTDVVNASAGSPRIEAVSVW